MPDLRDDLGRLADFVGEPRGLDDLAAARRRRERRRRAEGLVAGIAVVLATALFLVSTFRSDSDLVRARRLHNADGRVPGPHGAVPVAGELGRSTGADALAATTASVAAGEPLSHGASTRSWSSGGSRRRYWAGQTCPCMAAVGSRDAVVGSLARALAAGVTPRWLETIRVDRLPDAGVRVDSSGGRRICETGYEHGLTPCAADLAIQLEPAQQAVQVGRSRGGGVAHIGVVLYDGCSSVTSLNDAFTRRQTP